MEEIKILDIGNINCWIVNLKPTDNHLLEFQQKCVQKKVFGIGWSYAEHYNTPGELVLQGNREDYVRNYNIYAENNKFGHISNAAINNMEKIKQNDIVMMRLQNGHYYIGRVSKEAFFDNTIFENEIDNQIMSWMCKVEKWFEFKTDYKLPAEIRGRFSQRLQSTITRTATYRTRLLMISVYEKASGMNIVGVPKIRVFKDNFARSLNYTELEDLVCKYIYEKHKDEGYMLLPSSGKVSQIKYEFTFVNDTGLPITCQVKNQNSETIRTSYYIDDCKNYHKIYLFSGNNNISKDKSAENIEIIGHDELYKTLLGFKYMHERLKEYYQFNESSDYDCILKKFRNSDAWKEGKKSRKKANTFTVSVYEGSNEDNMVTKWITLGYDGFFYTDDFNCFVISWNDERTEKIKENITKLLNDKE